MSYHRCLKKRLTFASRIWPSVLFNLSKNFKKALDDAKVLNPKPFFLHSLPDFLFTFFFPSFSGGVVFFGGREVG
jgi:hypothetical protein